MIDNLNNTFLKTLDLLVGKRSAIALQFAFEPKSSLVIIRRCRCRRRGRSRTRILSIRVVIRDVFFYKSKQTNTTPFIYNSQYLILTIIINSSEGTIFAPRKPCLINSSRHNPFPQPKKKKKNIRARECVNLIVFL